MKIPANRDFAKFFQFAAELSDYARVVVRNDAQLTLSSISPTHVSALEVKYTVPTGTPLEAVGSEVKYGVRTAFIATALRNGMEVWFTPEGMVAATEKRKATQKYVLQDDEPLNLDEIVEKQLVDAIPGRLDIGEIRAAEKFGIPLEHAHVSLQLVDDKVMARFHADFGLDYEAEVGSLDKKVGAPMSIAVSWGHIAGLRRLCQYGSMIPVLLKPQVPLVFSRSEKGYSDAEGTIQMRYFVAPMIEAEPAPVEQDEERPEEIQAKEGDESEGEEEGEEEAETEEEAEAPLPSAQ